MSDGPSGQETLGDLYRQSRQRIDALVRDRPSAGGRVVETCPGWDVGDVVAHLVAVLEDVMAGTLTGPPAGAEADAQVARRSGVALDDVLDEWAGLSPAFERMVTDKERWPAVLDVISHEHDIRHALATTGGRTLPVISRCAHQLLTFLRSPVPMEVVLDGAPIEIRLRRDAPAADGADVVGGTGGTDGTGGSGGSLLVLRTGTFETLRWRTGRRSRRQLAAMDWDGDPGPVLDGLAVFGPSEVDIAE